MKDISNKGLVSRNVKDIYDSIKRKKNKPFFFMAAPTHGNSQARDLIQAGAVTYATAAATLDP